MKFGALLIFPEITSKLPPTPIIKFTFDNFFLYLFKKISFLGDVIATNNIFALDGIALETGAASTNAVDGEVIKGNTTTTAIGYTFLVRDEASGATKKLLLSDLISSGRTDYTASAGDETANAGTIDSAGMPLDNSKVSVYRNGAKLRAGTDYTLSLVATVATVTLVPQAGAPGDWVIYENDQFEVHWIKF